MSYRMRIGRCLLAVAASASFIVGASEFVWAEQARRVRIADETSPVPSDRVFFNYNYFQVGVEGGVSGHETTAGIGNFFRETIGFERTFLGGDASIGIRLPFAATNAGLVTGVKFRFYFGDDEDQGLIGYNRDFMLMPYVGMPILLGPAGPPVGGQQYVFTPFAGPIFEFGELHIFNAQGTASITRFGVGVGANFDVLFAPTANGFVPFFGVGGQVSFMQKVEERIDNFDAHLDRNAELRGIVRVGALFPR